MTHGRSIVYTVDAASAGAIVASFFGYLPSIAALAALVWYIVQICESRPVRRWRRLSRWKRIRRRRAALAARVPKD